PSATSTLPLHDALPIFDINGEVVGVNSAIFSPTGGSVGIGFAIPAETVKTIAAELKDKGSVRRGWIGVEIQPVTPDLAEALGLEDRKSTRLNSSHQIIS